MPSEQQKRLVTLKKRPEFLRIRGGIRYSTKSFLLEGKRRASEDAPLQADQSARTGGASQTNTPARGRRVAAPATARFGFTITKKIGGAVERNRIRRRLKAALSELSGEASSEFDYVVVARKDAIDQPFDALKADLSSALRHIARGAGKPRRPRQHKQSST